MERELKKILMEIEHLIKDHEQRGNTHTQSVLQIAYEVIEPCANAACTLSDLKEILDSKTDTNVGGKCADCSRRKFYQIGYEDGKKDNDGWIPCSERLPETGEHVLVSFKSSGFLPVVAFLSEDRRWFMLQGAKGFDDVTNSVVAWRPLPDPYRPERSDE